MMKKKEEKFVMIVISFKNKCFFFVFTNLKTINFIFDNYLKKRLYLLY